MGRVWLCEDEIAKRPLRLDEKGMELYSFEELCYYLYQNAELLEESFFNETLCQWLEQEVGQAELSKQIRAGLLREESGYWCIEKILVYGGFYSKEELKEVLLMVSWMEQKGSLGVAKLRGDRMLKEGRYQEALFAYETALQQASQYGDSEMVGRIWHNMGTLYAANMLFGQAAECYQNAYGTGQKEESKEAYLKALSCQEGKLPGGVSGRYVKARQDLLLQKQSGNRASYEKKIEELLETLRAEYRKSE